MPVAELLDRMSSEEITEWHAYFGLLAAEQKNNAPGQTPQVMSGR